LRSSSRGHFVPEQPRDLADLSGSDHAPRDVAKRAIDGVQYVPTPVIQGSTWRLIGGVVFTFYNRGGGVVEAVAWNALPEAVDVFLNWSWAGVSGLVSKIIQQHTGVTLRADLPSGFDASFEIGAKKV
jgi:hypothetical protein